MFRSVAIQRINQGLGFRPDGNSLEEKIVLALQEAQRDFEKGKTLPRFLVQESQTVTLTAGQHTAALPTGFLREDDEVPLHFFPTNATRPTFLERKFYRDAVLANLHGSSTSAEPDEPVPPSVYVLRRTTIDFITTSDLTYTLYWNYFKAADLLTTDIENVWLANASEWLIGEAGWRIAMDLRDADAVTKFDAMRKSGRAAVFGEELAQETSGGPLQMGANL